MVKQRELKVNKKILLVYGSGGHNEQMKRIYKGFNLLGDDNFYYISLCDNDVEYYLGHEKYVVQSVTNKFSYLKLIMNLPFRIYKILKVLIKINKVNNIDIVISTGPGISVIASLFFKFFSTARLIHVETWSRFYSKSLTGMCLYHIVDYFYVQNKELKKKYPKSIYKGRL